MADVYTFGVTRDRKARQHYRWSTTFGASSTLQRAKDWAEAEYAESGRPRKGEWFYVEEFRVDGLDHKVWRMVEPGKWEKLDDVP